MWCQISACIEFQMRIVGSSLGWIQNKTEQMENNVVILSGSRLGAENETSEEKANIKAIINKNNKSQQFI